jgi:hypothetical protein
LQSRPQALSITTYPGRLERKSARRDDIEIQSHLP